MKTINIILTVFIFTASLDNLSAQKVYSDENNVANKGYDVVNYFTDNVASRGSSDFSISYQGTIYYFTSAEHLEMFKKNPEQYLPQFGGYCSFAVAKMNKKVPVDPKTFRIDDGKLYLFYNDFWEGKPFNTIVPWINNEAAMTKMAQDNWKSLRN